MRLDPSLTFSILKGIHYISNEIVRQERHEGDATSFLFVTVLCVDFVDFILEQAGSFPGKYALTVIALCLLSQFRFVNVVLPFRHLGCSWISRVGERFQGNHTKYSFHRNTYTSSYSHSQAHWPRWRRPPTIESSSHFAQPLQTLHSPCAPACITTRDVIHLLTPRACRLNSRNIRWNSGSENIDVSIALISSWLQ